MLLISIGFLADGYTDPFYLKCTSPKQTSMILGISRAGQALVPSVFDSALATTYPGIDMYNFAFTLHWSPFGKVYLDAISQKLAKDTRQGVFIVTVDPWTIANFKDEQDDIRQQRENNGGLGRTRWMSANPNFSYLINAYSKPYMNVLATKIKDRFFNIRPFWQVHKDGWLEVSRPMDSASVAQRFHTTLDIYSTAYLPYCGISPIRKSYLAKTIAFLKEHGDVYLVRLPVHPSLLAVDNRLYPQFDAYMDSLAREQKTPYFNFSDSCGKYTYIDGSHLMISSGTLVTKELCRLIQDYRKEH